MVQAGKWKLWDGMYALFCKQLVSSTGSFTHSLSLSLPGTTYTASPVAWVTILLCCYICTYICMYVCMYVCTCMCACPFTGFYTSYMWRLVGYSASIYTCTVSSLLFCNVFVRVSMKSRAYLETPPVKQLLLTVVCQQCTELQEYILGWYH